MSAIPYGPPPEGYRLACARAYEAGAKVQDMVPDARQATAESLLLLVKAAGVAGVGRPPSSPEVHRLLDRLAGDGTGDSRGVRAVAVVRTAAMCLSHPEYAERWAEEASAAANRLVAEVTARA